MEVAQLRQAKATLEAELARLTAAHALQVEEMRAEHAAALHVAEGKTEETLQEAATLRSSLQEGKAAREHMEEQLSEKNSLLRLGQIQLEQGENGTAADCSTDTDSPIAVLGFVCVCVCV